MEASWFIRSIPVVEARWKFEVDLKKLKSPSVLLMFDEEYPHSHVKMGCVRYAARAFVSNPLFCRNCKRYGHVSSVCRRNVEESEGVRWCNCDGKHIPKSPECPFRVNACKVARATQQGSYTDVREIVEGAKGAGNMAVDAP